MYYHRQNKNRDRKRHTGKIITKTTDKCIQWGRRYIILISDKVEIKANSIKRDKNRKLPFIKYILHKMDYKQNKHTDRNTRRIYKHIRKY